MSKISRENKKKAMHQVSSGKMKGNSGSTEKQITQNQTQGTSKI